MTVPLVVDTDIGSNVDDALALALAVRDPGMELRAITTVSSEPEVRARMARALLDVAGAADVAVTVGASAPGDDRNRIGVEHEQLLRPSASRATSDRDASSVLATLPPDVALATIGQQTNVAAALARDADLPGRTAGLTVMGGVFAPVHTLDGRTHGPERDWNLILDPQAAVSSLSAGWRLRYVPLDVTVGVAMTRHHVERLRGGDALCVLLADLVDAWSARALARAMPEDVVAILHDPLTVACAADCAFVGSEELRVTPLIAGSGAPHTVVDPVTGSPADVVRAVDGPAFADWMVDVLLGT